MRITKINTIIPKRPQTPFMARGNNRNTYKGEVEYYKAIIPNNPNQDVLEMPLSGYIWTKDTRRGEQLIAKIYGKEAPYGERRRVKYEDGTVEDTLYSHGYPFITDKYENGEWTEQTQFEDYSNRKSGVRKMDGSFRLYKTLDKNDASIQLTVEKDGKLTIITLNATKEENGVGGADVYVSDGKNSTKEELFWRYHEDENGPKLKYSFSSRNDERTKENAKFLKKHLQDLQKLIYSDEYKQDFGHIKSLNIQLNKAIRYLDKISG